MVDVDIMWNRGLTQVHELQNAAQRELSFFISNTENTPKSTAVLRGIMKQLEMEIKNLEQMANKFSSINNNGQHNELLNIRKKHNELLDTYRHLFSSVQFSNTINSVTDMTNFSQGENQSVLLTLREEDRLLNEQDHHLGALEGTVHNLKNISYAISDEVYQQKKIINDLETHTDVSQSLLHQNAKKLKHIIKASDTLVLLLVAIILFCILVFLLVLQA